jgi:tetratricopeptide (TPR) repeat protein
MRSARRAAAVLLAAGAALLPRAHAAPDPEVATLLQRAEFWQARSRDDRAREEIDKALRLRPDQPEALLALGRLQLRANQENEAAATLQRLRQAHPQHPGVVHLSALLRVRGPDRDRLRQARQLARAGRNEEALAAFAALFPEGAPDDEMALEIATVQGWTREGWEPARATLADLAKRHPDDARYRVALASHLSRRKPVGADTLKTLRELSEHPSVPISRQAKESWRRAVIAMDPDETSLPALREYIAANPGETAVQERLETVERLIAQGKAGVKVDRAAQAITAGWAALQAGRLDEAGERFEEAMALTPRDGEAAGGLGLVRMRQGRHAEALEQFDRAAARGDRAKWERLADTARYWLLLAEARRAREAGELALAESKARQARAIGPREPDAAMELARVLVAAGRDREAEALLGELGPEDRARIAAAIDAVRAERLRDAAAKLQQQGQTAEAVAALERAAMLDRASPWLRLDLARLYAARGEPQRGADLFEELLRRLPREPDARYAQALYLGSISREGEAMAALEAIPAARRTAGMASLQRRLWATVQGSRAEALAASGREAEANAVVASMQAAIGEDRDLAIEVGRTLARLRSDAQLAALLERIGRMGPPTPEQAQAVAELERGIAMRRADTLRAAGRHAEAAGIYREVLARAPADRDARLGLLDALYEQRDYAGARAVVDEVLAASPNDARALAAASRLAEREGRLDDALKLERHSLAIEDRGESWRYRRLAELIDAQQSWYSGAVDWLYRSGTAGKSRVSAQEVPFAWRQGWTAGGRWFVRAAAARVSAGTFEVRNDYETSTFGSMLLCQPDCGVDSIDLAETGVVLGAGFERGPWRFDIASSPLGFPIENVLGGIAYRGEWGPVSYTLEASRRPVPSSLLSYAGTRDPNTGAVWGGVVADGVRLNVSRDSGGEYGAWALAGLYRLGGRNVLDNDKAEAMAGFYRRFVNEDDRLLTLGATAMFWRFAENAGEYTFGHGGYYSPGSYRSLGLPVAYAWRTPTGAFALRASVSVAWSRTREAPFFPTDAGLQAQAEAIAPTTFVDPFYRGGDDGRSYGRSFAAAGEQQVMPGVFVGGRIDIERSTNYTPSRFLLYVRFTLDGAAARPVSMPPEPRLPGFQF